MTYAFRSVGQTSSVKRLRHGGCTFDERDALQQVRKNNRAQVSERSVQDVMRLSDESSFIMFSTCGSAVSEGSKLFRV